MLCNNTTDANKIYSYQTKCFTIIMLSEINNTIFQWERPESNYALRIRGWVWSKAHSCVHGGWAGKGQNVHMLLTWEGLLAGLSICLKNNSMPVLNIRTVTKLSFIKDEIEMQLERIIFGHFVVHIMLLTDICIMLKLTLWSF